MKKVLLFMMGVAVSLFASCTSDNDDNYGDVYIVKIQLDYGDRAADYTSQQGVKVDLTRQGAGSVYTSYTDENGAASFVIPTGIYTVNVSDTRNDVYINSLSKEIIVSSLWNSDNVQSVEMIYAGSKTKVVIKELYVGGCQKDDGSGSYNYDQYVILHNNSAETVNLKNYCLAMCMPYNSNATNKDYVNGQLIYETSGWIPAANGIWYFSNSPELAPGEQIVVAFNHGIDNTVTYSNSINFDNADYYCCYDIESGYSHNLYYSSPAASIPVSHQLKAYKYGAGNGWPLSRVAPAFFVFEYSGSSLESFINDENTTNYYGETATDVNRRKKIETDWIVDGVEVFNSSAASNNKRLTSTIDAGSVGFEGNSGYTVYRNVDKKATEAIPENDGKIIYNYSLGVDPSGIDAEASAANGARIVYKDTNNSTVDFHQRDKASLRN